MTTEDEEVPIIGPRCLVAVVFTDYPCGVGDCRHEPSKQLFSSQSSEPFSSAPVSTYLSKDKVPNPLWGSVGYPCPPSSGPRQTRPSCVHWCHAFSKGSRKFWSPSWLETPLVLRTPDLSRLWICALAPLRPQLPHCLLQNSLCI